MRHAAHLSGRVLGYREQQVVAFVLRYYLDHCRKPTRAEIQEGCGFKSKGEVSRIVKLIESGGIVRSARTQHANHAGENL